MWEAKVWMNVCDLENILTDVCKVFFSTRYLDICVYFHFISCKYIMINKLVRRRMYEMYDDRAVQ